MISLKYVQFMSFEFRNAAQKLASIPFPAKVAYNIKKLSDVLNQHHKAIQEEYFALLKEYAALDAKGEPVRGADGGFDIPDDKVEAFKAREKEIGEKTFTVDRDKIYLGDLGDVKFSAAELSVLEPLLTEELATQPHNIHPIGA